MRKGFTMIELIFVIVILGILAAVAIPRLNATRDDAEISKGASNLATLMSDLSGYYTSKGSFNTTTTGPGGTGTTTTAVKWKDVTNVAMASNADGADIGETLVTTAAFLKVKDKGCVSLKIDGSKVEVKAGTGGICDQFKGIKSVQAIAGDGSAAKTHDFGGSQVKF
ncbi:type II secretion system protein [Campylobacter sp. RM16187]|uniref:type II secretion system protein n=1 Tax=Campylobacter sp. RM16187 TaxID=1660063 RepID=UPI0021B62015|nr:type II secretion system protein [Campylobacter sp. RM16187]QKG29570.1 putative type II secretion system protein [Campylobacter sp. RM16187]